MYYLGLGIEQDKKKAKQLYKKSCDIRVEKSCKSLKKHIF